MYNCISVCFFFLSFSFLSFLFSSLLLSLSSYQSIISIIFYGIHLHFCRPQTMHGKMQWNTHTHRHLPFDLQVSRTMGYLLPTSTRLFPGNENLCVCLCLNCLMRTLWGLSERVAVRAYERTSPQSRYIRSRKVI